MTLAEPFSEYPCHAWLYAIGIRSCVEMKHPAGKHGTIHIHGRRRAKLYYESPNAAIYRVPDSLTINDVAGAGSWQEVVQLIRAAS